MTILPSHQFDGTVEASLQEVRMSTPLRFSFGPIQRVVAGRANPMYQRCALAFVVCITMENWSLVVVLASHPLKERSFLPDSSCHRNSFPGFTALGDAACTSTRSSGSVGLRNYAIDAIEQRCLF